jgi:hypothetical protein
VQKRRELEHWLTLGVSGGEVNEDFESIHLAKSRILEQALGNSSGHEELSSSFVSLHENEDLRVVVNVSARRIDDLRQVTIDTT